MKVRRSILPASLIIVIAICCIIVPFAVAHLMDIDPPLGVRISEELIQLSPFFFLGGLIIGTLCTHRLSAIWIKIDKEETDV